MGKVRKGLWSPEEDEKLTTHIALFGVSCWSSIPELAGLQRCGKSCRLRWMNYLRPDLKRGRFSRREEELITALHQALGNSWAQIAARLPGRSDNEIKNFWNARLRKRLRQKATDGTVAKEEVHDQKQDSTVQIMKSLFNPFPLAQDHTISSSYNADTSSYCNSSSTSLSGSVLGDHETSNAVTNGELQTAMSGAGTVAVQDFCSFAAPLMAYEGNLFVGLGDDDACFDGTSEEFWHHGHFFS